MSSYKERRRTAEEQAKRHEKSINDLVKDTKKMYSLVKTIESQVNRINNLIMMLMAASMSGISGGISKPLQVPEEVYIGHPFLTSVTVGGEPVKTALPTGISSMINLGIVATVVPIVIQIVTAIVEGLARKEVLRLMRKWETEERERSADIVTEAKNAQRELYRSVIS